MTAKEYLEQYKEAERIVQRIREEYLKQMEQVDNIRSSLGGDGLPRSGDISKKVEAQAVRLAEKAEQLLQAEADALAIRQQVFRIVQKVQGDPGDVLHERYVNLRKWEDIADILGYTVRNCRYLHDKGLEELDGLIR
jgi:hypothetical protein